MIVEIHLIGDIQALEAWPRAVSLDQRLGQVGIPLEPDVGPRFFHRSVVSNLADATPQAHGVEDFHSQSIGLVGADAHRVRAAHLQRPAYFLFMARKQRAAPEGGVRPDTRVHSHVVHVADHCPPVLLLPEEGFITIGHVPDVGVKDENEATAYQTAGIGALAGGGCGLSLTASLTRPPRDRGSRRERTGCAGQEFAPVHLGLPVLEA